MTSRQRLNPKKLVSRIFLCAVISLVSFATMLLQTRGTIFEKPVTALVILSLGACVIATMLFFVPPENDTSTTSGFDDSEEQ